jgi:hypothetical protein
VIRLAACEASVKPVSPATIARHAPHPRIDTIVVPVFLLGPLWQRGFAPRLNRVGAIERNESQIKGLFESTSIQIKLKFEISGFDSNCLDCLSSV